MKESIHVFHEKNECTTYCTIEFPIVVLAASEIIKDRKGKILTGAVFPKFSNIISKIDGILPEFN